MPKKIGRPTKYQGEKTDAIALALTKARQTDLQIASILEVSEQTLNTWKHLHPTFLESLKRGKEETDDMVELTLLQRAMGMQYTETQTKTKKIEIGDDPDNPVEADLVETTETIKTAIPDVGAMAIWLNNRRPDRWKNRRHVEGEGSSEAIAQALAMLASKLPD